MNTTNTALLGLVVVLLFFISPNLRRLVVVGIALWIWLACILLSGAVAWLASFLIDEIIGPSDGGILLFFTPLGWLIIASFSIVASDLAFLVLYRVVGYGVLTWIERKWKVELAKPSTALGLVLAPISPFIVWLVYRYFRAM